MMRNGYDFYFAYDNEVLRFPITPGELTITIGSRNETIDLINDGEVNILKSPALTEVEFEARFPMRNYPYVKEFTSFKSCFAVFKKLKEDKKSFRFIVAREKPGLKTRWKWDTNLLVSLEEVVLKENADEGDDVILSFTLKQYKPYGVVAAPWALKPTSGQPRDKKSVKQSYYTVKRGDTLWAIAKKQYGDATKWPKIYNANKTAIEADAKKHGRSSSSRGHWIWPGLKLTIPSA